MVRVAGLKQQLTGEVDEMAPDGMTVGEQLAAISARVHELVATQSQQPARRSCPSSPRRASSSSSRASSRPRRSPTLDARFHNEVFPILTPIAIDPGHPFPHVRNKSLNLGVMFTREGTLEPGFGVVQVPSMLPRLLAGRGREDAERAAGDARLRAARGPHRAPRRRPSSPACASRASTSSASRATSTSRSTRKRPRTSSSRSSRSCAGASAATRCASRSRATPPPASLAKLVKALKLDPEQDVYRVGGHAQRRRPDAASRARDERARLRDEPFTPHAVPPLRDADDIFAVLREQDVLLHHPYESFDSVVELIARAADDPDVLAIKQTLYRAGGDSPIVKALVRAAESGKQVTAIVELKARFDEESNIVWARTLEQAGAHVVYGLLGLKTHAKCLLIVRREKGKLRRYVHLVDRQLQPDDRAPLHRLLALHVARRTSARTSRASSTCSPATARRRKWNKLIVAPLGLHEAVLGLIAREAEHARAGRPGAHRRQDERARRRRRHRGALPRVAGGRADHAPRPRHLLPAARASRA